VDSVPPRVCSLRAIPVNVPLARPHPTASGMVESAPLVLLDLETDQGLVGRSYVFCYTPIALRPIAGLIEALQSLIQGDLVAPLALAQKLQARFRLLGPQGFTGIAIAAIDMAAWDVLAKSAGLSLTSWLRAVSQTDAAGLPVSSHLFPELSAQLLAACSQAHWLEYQDWAAPILEQPLAVRDGFALPQTEAGCGLAWNKDAVERYRLR